MKMSVNHAPAALKNTQTSTKSVIMQTGAMFDLLSTRLYSRPMDAAIRETLKNALDAHIDAKQSRPVQITTPTSTDPHLIIRDFGKGLSPEQVQSNFINYGDTSKDDSPDQHGGMGIGSKAPFSITDQFSIVSRHNGTETTYIFFRQPGQGPEIASATSKPTTETGLEIIIPIPFPVRDSITVLEKLLAYFPENFATVDGTLFTPPKPVYQNDFGKLYEGYNNVQVQAGPVLYDYDNSHHTELFEGLFNIVLTIPANLVTVAPSRESLIDDDITRKAYKEQLIEFLDVLPLEYVPMTAKHLPETMNKQLSYDPRASQWKRSNGTKAQEVIIRYLDDLKTKCHNVPREDIKAVFKTRDINRLVNQPKPYLEFPDGFWALPDILVIHDDVVAPAPKKYWDRMKLRRPGHKIDKVLIVSKPPPAESNVPHIKLSSIELPPPPPRIKSATPTLSNFRVWRGRGDSQYGEFGWFKATRPYIPQNAIIHDLPIDPHNFRKWNIDLERVIIHHKNPTNIETFTEYKARKIKALLDNPSLTQVYVEYNTVYHVLSNDERRFNQLLLTARDPAAIPEHQPPEMFFNYQEHLPVYDLTAFRDAIKKYPLLYKYAVHGDIKMTIRALMDTKINNSNYDSPITINCDLMALEDYLEKVTSLSDGHGHPSNGTHEDTTITLNPSDGDMYIPTDATHIAWYAR